MKLKIEPEELDLGVNPTRLTEAEQKHLSDFMEAYKGIKPDNEETQESSGSIS
jgi:hypothetical protein